MSAKTPDPTRPGVTSSSSHLSSMYGKDFVELAWQNGQLLVQRGVPSSKRQGSYSCTEYSVNPSHGEAYDEDICITKKVKLSTCCLDFPASHKDCNVDSLHKNSQRSNEQNCYNLDLPYTKSKNAFKHIVDTILMVEDKYSDFRAGKEPKLAGGTHQIASCGNIELCSSSLQQCPASASFITPISFPSSQKQDSRTVEKINFPNFVRPAKYFKSTYQGNSATRQRNSAVLETVKEIKAGKDDQKSVAATKSKAPYHSVVNDSSTKGTHSLGGSFQEQKATNASQVPLVAKCSQESLRDERSKTMGHNSALRIQGSRCQNYNQASSLAANRANGKSDTYLCSEQLVPSTSVCSLGASNDPTYLSRKHELEDTYDSANSSEDDDEQEGLKKEAPPRVVTRGERSRNAKIHNLSEKKRRDKINKKMRALKELIPNCNKMDKASMLDDAIEYLKTLKLQLQIMSLGSGMCMPFMMLPAGANHLSRLHLTQFPQLGLRPSTGTPCNLPQFPPPQFGPASLPGITANRLQMLGFPSQMLPMSIPQTLFMPMLGKPSTVLPTSCTPSNLVQHLASATLHTSKDSSVSDNAASSLIYYIAKQRATNDTKAD
ncbi:hypothetical protein L6164_034866 [Bauhinia variegata]|uniref:Uncharacterized protein n=1 Tax=Bauhinia variegata TaxID=167791 RepID=A0ACB9KWF6_BAUVA|nr:hypothetical protein L6164_034866 [Bauhinia variegata]